VVQMWCTTGSKETRNQDLLGLKILSESADLNRHLAERTSSCVVSRNHDDEHVVRVQTKILGLEGPVCKERAPMGMGDRQRDRCVKSERCAIRWIAGCPAVVASHVVSAVTGLDGGDVSDRQHRGRVFGLGRLLSGPALSRGVVLLGAAASVVGFGLIALHGSSAFADVANLYVQSPANGGSDSGNTTCAQSTPCATIGQAITDAAVNDTIVIGPGTFGGNVEVPFFLSFIGSGPNLTTIDEPLGDENSDTSLFIVQSGGSFSNLTLDGTKDYRVEIECWTGCSDIALSNDVLSNSPVTALLMDSGTLSVSGSTFLDDRGDGLAFQDGVQASIADSLFLGDGTGIGNLGSGTTISMMDSTIANGVPFSQPDSADGIDSTGADTQISVINSTIYGNQGYGISALYNWGEPMVLRDDTIADNAAVGLYEEYGKVSVADSIIAGNQGNGGNGYVAPYDDCWLTSASLADNGNNLVGGTNNCNFTNDDLVGTATTPLDPELGPLTGNGGPVSTVALLPGSPAINAANPTDCQAAPVSDLDERGFPRNAEARGTCDIGAYDTGVSQPSTISISSDESDVVVGETVTLTATVSPMVAGGPTPTGTVTFSDPLGPLCGANLNQSDPDQASCSVPLNNAPSDTVIALYRGNPTYSPSTSPPLTVTVAPASTSASLAADTSSPVTGQPVTYTVTVTPVAPGAGSPTGQVTVTDTTGQTCTAILNNATAGQAACEIPAPAPGTHQVTATYDGSTDYTLSTSNTVTESVTAAATITAISASPEPSVTGGMIKLTARVEAVSPSVGQPTGKVTFVIENASGKQLACQAGNSPTLSAGAAVCQIPRTANVKVGDLYVLVGYRGAAGYQASDTSAYHQVTPDSTAVQLTSSTDPSIPGQAVTFTAFVSANSPGSGTPRGKVVFSFSPTGTITCQGGNTIKLTAAGTAVCKIPKGQITSAETVTADYQGGKNYLPSAISIIQNVS
jgi:hypothetical protein